jgi:hypothetical protein
MDENEIFETLTRFDSDAVDHMGQAVEILRAGLVSLESAKKLLEAIYANQESV